jgi:DNA (cytosine-5)-methyltransferase 1
VITFATACSGIDAWGMAVDPLGWQQLWCSEIEPFPCAVLKHRRPHVPNLGDMLALRDKIERRVAPAPDVFVAGTPCQAFSVAGLRNGLNDSRGQLTLEYVRICDAIDAVRYADGKTGGVFVWENVPGALSDDTNAFGCFLAGLVGEDKPLEPGPRPERGRSSEHWRWRKKTDCHVPKWSDAGVVVGPKRSVAWRVYDAQYFGLAQRRKRVFVVGCDRATGDPAKILFEPDGLRRDIAPSRKAGEECAGTLEARTSGGGGFGTDISVSRYLQVYENHGQDSLYKSIETCPTISAKAGTGENNLPIVVHGVDFQNVAETGAISGTIMGEAQAKKGEAGHGILVYSDGIPELANTLTARMAKGINTTLDEGQTPIVCMNGGVSHALTSEGWDASEDGTGRGRPKIATTLGVRRLMPVECERLMGFPDNYTLIPWRKGMAPDGPRYRAIGNSKARPICEWIARRIQSTIDFSK